MVASYSGDFGWGASVLRQPPARPGYGLALLTSREVSYGELSANKIAIEQLVWGMFYSLSISPLALGSRTFRLPLR